MSNWPDAIRLHVHNDTRLKATKTGETYSIFRGAPYLSFRGVTWIVMIVLLVAFWAGVVWLGGRVL